MSKIARNHLITARSIVFRRACPTGALGSASLPTVDSEENKKVSVEYVFVHQTQTIFNWLVKSFFNGIQTHRKTLSHEEKAGATALLAPDCCSHSFEHEGFSKRFMRFFWV
jgi:hypothetical protein